MGLDQGCQVLRMSMSEIAYDVLKWQLRLVALKNVESSIYYLRHICDLCCDRRRRRN